MKLEYEQNGDYMVPMLQMNEQPEGTVMKYGLMRQQYLKEHRNAIYTVYLLKGTLKEYLLTIQEQAEERMEVLVAQMTKAEGVTEQLKVENQMLWVQKMNNVHHRAEEIVQKELIYK